MSNNQENNKQETDGNSKIIGALLLGAAIGAGLGYLLASDEGKEIRKKVLDKVKNFVDDIKEKYEHSNGSGKEEKTT